MVNNSHGWIRVVYLYLFALVGLFALIFGLINGAGAVMNRYILPQQFIRYDYAKPVSCIDDKGVESTTLTLEQQKEQFTAQQNNEFRRRTTESLPAIVIGWLIWWFHWNWIKRDKKED